MNRAQRRLLSSKPVQPAETIVNISYGLTSGKLVMQFSQKIANLSLDQVQLKATIAVMQEGLTALETSNG